MSVRNALDVAKVNPARAGMILAGSPTMTSISSKPRASGDDPSLVMPPHFIGTVNPARAGMIREARPEHPGNERKPRASGDDPAKPQPGAKPAE